MHGGMPCVDKSSRQGKRSPSERTYPTYMTDMKAIFNRASVAARFDAWTEGFGHAELDMLVFEVERIFHEVHCARFPALEPGLFGDQTQADWLAAIEDSRIYLRRLVTQARGNVGRPPAAIDDIDPVAAAIWDVFDLPEGADEEFVESLAEACRAGEPYISQSGIRNLTLKKRKQGRKPRDDRVMLIAAAAHKAIYPDAHMRSNSGCKKQYARDKILRAAIRALTGELGILAKETTVSNFLARYRKSLALDDSLIGTQELRRPFDHDIDPSLFDVNQFIESMPE